MLMRSAVFVAEGVMGGLSVPVQDHPSTSS